MPEHYTKKQEKQCHRYLSKHMRIRIEQLVEGLLGQLCCRVKVGNGRSLSIGFGDKLYHGNTRLSDEYYGEWEIGSFQNNWRIVTTESIKHGGNDLVDNEQSFIKEIESLELGKITALFNLTDLDIRVEFGSKIIIDFMALSSDDDESFHIFAPNKVCADFVPYRGWKIGPSNAPWERMTVLVIKCVRGKLTL